MVRLLGPASSIPRPMTAETPARGGEVEQSKPGLVGSASSIPHVDSVRMTPFSSMRGGETEPTRLHPIKDPELRAAFMAAHVAWAHRYAPHLLEEWLDG